MKSLTRTRSKFDLALDILMWVAAALLIAVWIQVCLEVVLRYFFNRAMFWVVETSEYSLLYICFLATAWLLRREGHVKVDFLLARFSPRGQALLNAVTSVIAAAGCLLLVWFGGLVSWQNLQKGIVINSTLLPPKFLILMIIPLGSLMLFIQFLRRSWDSWKNQTAPSDEEQLADESKV